MFDQSRSTIAGVPRPTLLLWLGQAQAAQAQLNSGAKVASASYAQGDGSKSVTYTQASRTDLTNWILLLQQATGIGGPSRRPMRPIFT